MHIHYCYITDQVKLKELHIRHCTTADMLTDFFMQPLQGILLITLQNLIMGNDLQTESPPADRSVLRDVKTSNSEPAKKANLEPESEVGNEQQCH